MLGISRAVGETMIVVMAAGLAANLTFNPFEAVTTFTVQIKTILVGDQEFDSAKTLSAFALGFVLFFFTLMLNFIALRVVQSIGNSMTDISANAPRSRTDCSNARWLRRRYAAERRFKAYGVIAIAVTAVFLVVLFADILRKGLPAFTEHTLAALDHRRCSDNSIRKNSGIPKDPWRRLRRPHPREAARTVSERHDRAPTARR